MPISARNQLKGTVTNVRLGEVMAQVVIDVGGQEVVAAITRDSVENLDISEGEQVTAVIKATEVMVMK